MQDLLALRFRIGLLAVPLVLPWACASENPPAMMGMEPGLSPGRPPAATRPGNAVGGFAIQVPALTLMPGEEALPCYVFPLEITGPSRLVTAAVLSTQPGLHHRNVTTRAKTGDGIRTCDEGGLGDLVSEIVSGGTVLFASSTQVVGSEWHNFPAGMAFPVAADQEIVVRMHYLNASPNPITVAPHYQWYTIAEADLQQQLAPLSGRTRSSTFRRTASTRSRPTAPSRGQCI